MARTDWLTVCRLGRLRGAPGPFEGNLITASSQAPRAGNLQPAQYMEALPILPDLQLKEINLKK